MTTPQSKDKDKHTSARYSCLGSTQHQPQCLPEMISASVMKMTAVFLEARKSASPRSGKAERKLEKKGAYGESS